ncbi:MAG: hypothetical protein NTY16_10925 [Deltaproteobacteria bacterium]|nr:hypothetical protein [Deltaproteobacteria bacterium]
MVYETEMKLLQMAVEVVFKVTDQSTEDNITQNQIRDDISKTYKLMKELVEGPDS